MPHPSTPLLLTDATGVVAGVVASRAICPVEHALAKSLGNRTAAFRRTEVSRHSRSLRRRSIDA